MSQRALSRQSYGGFIKGILRGVRCTKSLRVLFLHRRPPSWTTLVLYSRAVFLFNEPAYISSSVPANNTCIPALDKKIVLTGFTSSLLNDLPYLGFTKISYMMRYTVCSNLSKCRINILSSDVEPCLEYRCQWSLLLCDGILEQSMGSRNRVGIGLSYRPAKLHRLAESIPFFGIDSWAP
jgi:hypothetical protein